MADLASDVPKMSTSQRPTSSLMIEQQVATNLERVASAAEGAVTQLARLTAALEMAVLLLSMQNNPIVRRPTMQPMQPTVRPLQPSSMMTMAGNIHGAHGASQAAGQNIFPPRPPGQFPMGQSVAPRQKQANSLEPKVLTPLPAEQVHSVRAPVNELLSSHGSVDTEEIYNVGSDEEVEERNTGDGYVYDKEKRRSRSYLVACGSHQSAALQSATSVEQQPIQKVGLEREAVPSVLENTKITEVWQAGDVGRMLEREPRIYTSV